ncbi:L,D-transpeptidase family protein [Serratia rhizosphaerae]|nr:L,D-transpeptidase family protein [Serratia rubidaea]QPT14457.1 L,D-transpeptidase family protein [Serratia rubidaea]SQJ28083.1 Uncharacterized protein conserved in bacteria [Serratia rubidaea]
MHRLKRPGRVGRYLLIFFTLLVLCPLAYSWLMARFGYGAPPAQRAAAEQVDQVLIRKASRTLSLLKDNRVVASYPIALGGAADGGAKTREGDRKTPEGDYTIDWRNSRSKYFLSLHISYPDADDIAQAKAGGYSPGSHIMIHGQPNGWGWLAPLLQRMDWTDGCIAVTNAEMQDVWSRVPAGTPVRIEP